jgi:chemotaxis protein methyltransferase CheR
MTRGDRSRQGTGEDCVAFLQWALPRLGMRWAGFRKVRRQVCKRIAARIRELGLAGFDAYRRHLDGAPDEWAVLDSFCRVTISRFHRDRGVFELMRDRLLPDIAAAEADRIRLAGRPPTEAVVRCWSAGAASGEEPYTLALLWRLLVQERFPGIRLHVLATDADEKLLARARAACYPASSLRELPAGWIEAAFEPAGDELRLRPAFCRGVSLLRQDIRDRMPRGPFHMVLCRNLVFTYFDTGLQARLLHDIVRRLLPGGFLVVGAHEALPRGDWPLARLGPGTPVFRRS